MSLARKASSANAIRTLDMIVSDKQPYADAAGAVSPYDIYGTPEMFVADAGTSFANHDVRARVVDMNIIFMTTVSAVPFLRGAVERVFRTTNCWRLRRSGQKWRNAWGRQKGPVGGPPVFCGRWFEGQNGGSPIPLSSRSAGIGLS